jgi:hypothetical protein
MGSALDQYNRKPSMIKNKYIIFPPPFQPREVKFNIDLGRRQQPSGCICDHFGLKSVLNEKTGLILHYSFICSAGGPRK